MVNFADNTPAITLHGAVEAATGQKWVEATAYRITTRLAYWYAWDTCRPTSGVDITPVRVLIPDDAELKMSPLDTTYLYKQGQHYKIPYGFSQALAKGLVIILEEETNG